jgi:hypothetical protein
VPAALGREVEDLRAAAEHGLKLRLMPPDDIKQEAE